MIFGAILAGGVGSRMNIADMPKQFLPLGNKPIVVHTLEKFMTCSRFDYIYVGVHPDWVVHMNDLVEKYIPVNKEKIKIVSGGTDRNSTIFNIVADIEANFGESADHIIVTHDSVRPFLTLRIIEENIDSAIKYGAADTVTSAIDTIVESTDGKFIASIPERKKMYQGQTPQSFNIVKLKTIFASLTNEEKEILTDACKIFVVRNEPVYLVEGDYTNIKITTTGDYKIAQAMVGGISFD